MPVDLPCVLARVLRVARVKAEKNQWRRATDQKFYYYETMDATLARGRDVHSFVASRRVSLTGIILLSRFPFLAA